MKLTDIYFTYRTTENLLHRLFVCIAGVADQLQTNFASDLRQILKSVFLINSTPPPEEITIEEKTKETDLFEFRASESDVIQQENNSGGSNQSIYSAEEVNPESSDCVFEDSSNGEERGHRSASLGNENNPRFDTSSIGSGDEVVGGNRNNVERSSSVGDSPNSDNVADVNNSIKYHLNITSNNNNPSNESSNNRSRSNEGSPVNPRSNAFISSSSSTSDRTSRNRSISATETPPRWIPDHEVKNCMSCVTPFTPFRRRHHCRNCGGVFCNICSKSQKPLPKYGLIKAVRVCRDCFEDENRN